MLNSNTHHYKELLKNISKQRRNFLPKISPTGSYTDKEYELTKAFKIFCHAELEHYFEHICRKISTEAYKKWKKLKTPSLPLIYLFAFTSTSLGEIPESTATQKPQLFKVSKRVERVVNDYSSVIYENHGIKEKNLLKLLLPIGIDYKTISQTLLSELNSYGAHRGEIAHKAISRMAIDPKNETVIIMNILKEIRVLDISFFNILNQI